MIWFWIVAGCLTVAALAALLRPLIVPPRRHAEDEEPVTALYRRQLAAIEVELAQGRLMPEQTAAARTEITRRMLAATKRESSARAASAESASETSWRFGAAIGIAGLLPAAAIALYFALGTPAAIVPGATTDAASPHGAAELAAAADRIKAHLRQTPGDLRGWILLARTSAALGRFPEAREDYAHAIALAPAKTGLHAELGEVLVLAAQGQVTAAAEAELAKAPDDPRSRYYGAEAALQRGDTAGARQKLQALLAAAPADAPWRQAVADRLAELSPTSAPPASGPPTAAAPGSGPTAQDVAAAESMTPAQRETMIRAMVERLAQRLQQHPGDSAGWVRLARAYDVLGEPDKAQAARARAAEARAGAATAGGPPAASAPAASSAAAPGAAAPPVPTGAARSP